MINLGIILLATWILPTYFRHRYRNVIRMLNYIAQAYDQPPVYSYTPVSIIKKQLYNHENASYLRKHEYKINAQSSLIIIHEGQEYDFYHYLPKKSQGEELASILIYLLKQGVPYELLYEHSKTIHTALS